MVATGGTGEDAPTANALDGARPRWRLPAAVLAVALVAAYAALSGLWVSAGDAWYRSLQRPAWQPPDAVFGIIWPYNFTVLAVTGALVAWRAPRSRVVAWLAFLAASAAAALAWAYLFYVPHRLAAAALALAVAAVLTVPLVVLARTVSRLAALALLPYLAWVTLAATLAAGYWRLNHG